MVYLALGVHQMLFIRKLHNLDYILSTPPKENRIFVTHSVPGYFQLLYVHLHVVWFMNYYLCNEWI